MDVDGSSLVTARVLHRRDTPTANCFVYGMDCLLLDDAALAGRSRLRLFSYGQPNLVSLHPADHGIGAIQGRDEVRQAAREAGIDGIRSVMLLCHPRYWGYTFNPVSFWFLLGAGGSLRAVLAEVHNTYGERHGYLCHDDAGGDIRPATPITARKHFHVSPFFDIRGTYRFTFHLDPERVAVRIDYDDGEGGGLVTSIAGPRRPLTDRALLRALSRRPLGALRVSALIHWQALRLWAKGVRFRKRPPRPDRNLT